MMARLDERQRRRSISDSPHYKFSQADRATARPLGAIVRLTRGVQRLSFFFFFSYLKVLHLNRLPEKNKTIEDIFFLKNNNTGTR